jgi:hypothetical protein
MIVPSRFTRGEETRKQPERQLRDFQKLMKHEQQLTRLTDELNARVVLPLTPELRSQRKESIEKHPELMALCRNIEYVSL